jgi:diadenosine tetraphosphate (Ap4A) HIT family hydrolase
MRPVTSPTHPFVARLPVGRRIPLPEDGAFLWSVFPFEGEFQVRVLEPPELPEPPRHGEDGPDSCRRCQEPERNVIWGDEHWVVTHLGEPSGLPLIVMLHPRGHHDFSDLPTERSAELGPLMQRIERAMLSLGGIARVHVNRWGDGAAHLHIWFIARPEGMMQLRGACLALWDDVLPKAPHEEWQANLTQVAKALAAAGGTTYL